MTNYVFASQKPQKLNNRKNKALYFVKKCVFVGCVDIFPINFKHNTVSVMHFIARVYISCTVNIFLSQFKSGKAKYQHTSLDIIFNKFPKRYLASFLRFNVLFDYVTKLNTKTK